MSNFNFRLDQFSPEFQASQGTEWRIQHNETADGVELLMFDGIGDDENGLSAKQTVEFFSKHKDSPIHIRANSPGGSAFEGLVMAASIRDHGNVTTTVEGNAYSAAAIAISTSKTIRMQPQATMGIHRAWGLAVGNKNTFLALAEFVGKIDDGQVELFAERTGIESAQIEAYLDGKDAGALGTMFSATEAVDLGFADEIVGKSRKDTPEAEARLQAFMARNMTLSAKRQFDLIRSRR